MFKINDIFTKDRLLVLAIFLFFNFVMTMCSMDMHDMIVGSDHVSKAASQYYLDKACAKLGCEEPTNGCMEYCYKKDILKK